MRFLSQPEWHCPLPSPALQLPAYPRTGQGVSVRGAHTVTDTMQHPLLMEEGRPCSAGLWNLWVTHPGTGASVLKSEMNSRLLVSLPVTSWPPVGRGRGVLGTAGTTTLNRLPIPRSLLWHLVMPELPIVPCADPAEPAVRPGKDEVDLSRPPGPP